MAEDRSQRSLFDPPDTGSPVPVEPAEASAPAAQPGPAPARLAGKTVYVIDAHSLIHQLFHALPEMTSPSGQPVGAVYGFCRDLLFLLEQKQPDYLFCAFDMPGKTFRHALYEQYKGHRPETDVDLVPQIEAVRRVVEVLGIPALAHETYEADDILATVARLAEQHGADCFLVTSDKDCRQLITDRVRLYNIRKDQAFDREALREAWGIAPEQVVDFQALVGDATDHVPGVRGIGEGFARQLLQQYGTLDNLLAHAEEVARPKLRQALRQCREEALLSRKLVTLDRHVPVELDWEAAGQRRVDLVRADALFRELGFRSLAARLMGLAGSQGTGGAGSAPDLRASPIRTRIIQTPDALEQLCAALRTQKSMALDTETVSMDPRGSPTWPRWAELVGLSLATCDAEGYYLPLRAPAGQTHLDPDQTLASLRPLLEDPRIEKIGQNLKYDMVVLRSAGVMLRGVAFDCMVASYLLDAGARAHNLDELAKRYLGHETIPIESLIGSGKNQKRMDEVPLERIAQYAAEDAVLPWRLRPILQERLAEAGLQKLYVELELPLIDVLVELEYNGIRVDVERLAALGQRFGQRMVALEAEIHELAGRPFNIASPKQLQQVLFQECGLPVLKRTPTGPSTDSEVLEELAAIHRLPAKILQYRQYAKLKGTYVDALPAMVHPRTGRVHASFHQAVAATGRLSSSDPNLQNIPIRTEEGRAIRAAFVPGEPGWQLLSADYSQIELRVLAHFSGDERLCQAFARDEDIHARVASQIYGVRLDHVTPEMRRQAKAVNFGVIYGQSPFGLAKQLRIDKAEAARFIDAYFAGYPGIERFLNQVLAECRHTGYVSTILGRRRAIQGVRPHAGRQRNLAERTAINTVIQGSAADLIKRAMVATLGRLRREGLASRMLLQIHDELVFETPPQEVPILSQLVREEMASAYPLKVPLKVDIGVGPTWAETK